MPKKCPPGVFCIENMTLGFLFVFLFFVIAYFGIHLTKVPTNFSQKKTSVQVVQPNIPYSNIPGDVYSNPYSAPLRDNRHYVVSNLDIRGDPMSAYLPSFGNNHSHSPMVQAPISGIPVNVPTQSIDTHYRQVGILTRNNSHDETILALMGRPLFTSRDKWQFYTMSDKNNSVKLPVSKGGRSCTNEYGCDNLYNGDTVYVEGYNDAFKVTIYDNSNIQYIPAI